MYKPFFGKLGGGAAIKDGVTFKYPSEIFIGENATIGEFCYLVGKGGLVIGKDALIAAGCKIVTSSHHYSDKSRPINKQGLVFEKVSIGDNVWLGFDVKILSGSSVPSGSVVGANSLVNSKLEIENYIYVGSPAIPVRSRC